ncbi:glucan endo-1,3-beta-glucosidase 8-like [Olea europaea subsp. europaea]|uniref:Glucan endo-1,3-beta-glucosidase 8-like n=1 Tax=Olea europaea subsp. europaea TaxID=158383 RepID=A0A8S0R8Z3_OLEEU|nr:glucan endo-1,3-beta-glucosidase 8-like [Olea europaea subsp. europaea]
MHSISFMIYSSGPSGKQGCVILKLMAGQVGWPTEATPENAERFYKSLLPYVTSNRETPMQPGPPIDIFLYSLSDENLLKIDRGTFQCHWGIYNFDGCLNIRSTSLDKGMISSQPWITE